MTNIVALAVSNLMKGAAEAPIVPTALTHPKDSEVMFEGNNSAIYTKKMPHTLFKTNLRKPSRTISEIVCALS